MSKSLLQTIAEIGASAHPDAFWVLLGYVHTVYLGSKAECESFQRQHPKLPTKLVGTSQVGEYMVASKRRLK